MGERETKIEGQVPSQEEFDLINEIIIEANRLIFQKVIKKLSKRLGKRKTKELEVDFEEYIKVYQELFMVKKGEFKFRDVIERIPDNKWLKIVLELSNYLTDYLSDRFSKPK